VQRRRRVLVQHRDDGPHWKSVDAMHWNRVGSSLRQGCQILLGTIYQNGEKIYRMITTSIPRMTIPLTPFP
jgi:hypothetical protein